ncbi:hypothetical protein E5J99_15530 [Hymenobacter elongatus]|uniref:Uncharacterized protein n=1 Tax=Hymenobacter elongatus TaxID=877208 RepID=A0A4Z0PIB3_9BACT|nr:hypothetical protein E5J99_15530 [Hymenobacter elongatus]
MAANQFGTTAPCADYTVVRTADNQKIIPYAGCPAAGAGYPMYGIKSESTNAKKPPDSLGKANQAVFSTKQQAAP